MKCPHCNIEMGTTYEPYEYRCGKCGYWFDTYTGKEVTFAPPMSEMYPLELDEEAEMYRQAHEILYGDEEREIERMREEEMEAYWLDLGGEEWEE